MGTCNCCFKSEEEKTDRFIYEELRAERLENVFMTTAKLMVHGDTSNHHVAVLLDVMKENGIKKRTPHDLGFIIDGQKPGHQYEIITNEQSSILYKNHQSKLSRFLFDLHYETLFEGIIYFIDLAISKTTMKQIKNILNIWIKEEAGLNMNYNISADINELIFKFYGSGNEINIFIDKLNELKVFSRSNLFDNVGEQQFHFNGWSSGSSFYGTHFNIILSNYNIFNDEWLKQYNEDEIKQYFAGIEKDEYDNKYYLNNYIQKNIVKNRMGFNHHVIIHGLDNSNPKGGCQKIWNDIVRNMEWTSDDMPGSLR